MSSHTWSPQQAAFLEWAKTGTGSCILVAVAGAGKTTVLIEAGKAMGGNVLYVAYNKDVATETDGKLKAMNVDWKVMKASTAHAAGFGIIRKTCPGVRVEDRKVRDLFDSIISETDPLRPRQGEVLQLVSLAKQAAFGITVPIEDMSAWLEMAAHFDVLEEGSNALALIELAQRLLVESNRTLEVVDYDDMVYLPLVHRLPCWRYSTIMLDEAQDTNASRRALMRMLLRKGGRMVAVGDPAQAIYGFTGADSDSLDLIAADFNAVRLPLTVTFRCPKAVVEVAQQWVSHISAADSAPEGIVSEVSLDEFMGRNDLNGRSAVLCRLNRPLVSLAFALLRRRVACRIAGRDVGGGLKKLLGRWKVTSLDDLEDRLDSYLAAQTSKLLAKKQESRIAAVEDQVETCRVIIQACRSNGKFQVSDTIAWVDSMFTDEKGLNLLLLSSIHKSKGREWEHVYWLDRAGTCPSKWARQAWQQKQEVNLQYVCATRAKAELTDIIVPVEPREERQ
jgi:DNA helicase II / ATP-dependent DNA helicase PcrA